MLDSPLYPIAMTAAAIAAGFAVRVGLQRKQANETARHVEAERIVALLSARQPGVWDQEELRHRILTTARELWSAPTREALARLEQWVSPTLLAHWRQAWPVKSVRREVKLNLKGSVAFVQVVEGGPQADRLIARLLASRESAWLDAASRRIKFERRRLAATYHTWVHIDGQGWRLEDVTDAMPAAEPPPSSVSCRILPSGPVEDAEARRGPPA